MNEAQRLVYLEALGIQQWVAKAALPNAKATEWIVNDLQVVEEKTSAVKIGVEKISAVSETRAPRLVNDENSAQKNQKIFKEEDTKQIASTQVKPAMLACALQIQGKRGQYLLIADLHDSKGKINSNEQNLLNNISKGINSLLENTSTNPIAPEQFKWPMFESHFKAEHIDQSAQAAKESAQAFLFSHIKRDQLPLVIALGKQVHFLLGLDGLEKNHLENHKIITPNFGETQFILGASLAEMMQANAQSMKAELWKSLVKHFV